MIQISGTEMSTENFLLRKLTNYLVLKHSWTSRLNCLWIFGRR